MALSASGRCGFVESVQRILRGERAMVIRRGRMSTWCRGARPVQRCTLVLAGVSLAVASGCALDKRDALHFLPAHEHDVSAIEYRVGIPDTVGISAPRVLEIDGESQTIHPDGKISLRLLGDVKVVGMTAKEIAAQLEVLLSRYYLDPKVSVRVLGYNSKKYYLYGEVGGVGPKPYTGRDTLVDAIMNAGTSFTSWLSRVKVIRPSSGDGPVRSMQFNVKRMIESGDFRENILLEPGDIVYIPPTPGAWLHHRVRDVMYPVEPVARAYTAPGRTQDEIDAAYDDDDD